MTYKSHITVESVIFPGVRYTIARMSFGRRLELTQRIRELAQKLEFLEAGNDQREKLESILLSGQIARVYVLWALQGIDGLELDGRPATPETLAACGPEELFREALAAIKAECGLTENERKN